jgi:arginyl-tRNA synthetase
VIVGFEQLEKKSLAEVRALGGRFDYYCWDLYARVFEWYGEDKERKALQAATLHAIEKHEGPTAELGEYVAARIVRAHIATMRRLDIGYDLLVRESDILRQHFWAKAFELLKETKAIHFEEEGKAKGCWVLGMSGSEDGLDENKIIVRSNGTVTYTGKDIAYQLWKLGKLGLDFRYRRHEDSTSARPLWSSTSGAPDGGAPHFGAGASLVFNVIDVGQSYPQRVVKAGVAALAGPEAAEGTRHLGYEKVVLSKATAKELGYEVDEDAGVVKVSGRRGLGVKADDLIDALEAKASGEIATRDPERSQKDREKAARDIAKGALRYFMLRFSRNRIITFDMEEALAFTGETGPYIQNSVVRAKSILARVAADGHDLGALLKRALDKDLLSSWLATEEGSSAWSLFLAMARTDEAIETAVRTEEPSVMTRHAFQIAQAFHGYYQNPAHTVLRAETEDLRAVRVLVVDLFVRHTTHVAGLLGIPIPDRM